MEMMTKQWIMMNEERGEMRTGRKSEKVSSKHRSQCAFFWTI